MIMFRLVHGYFGGYCSVPHLLLSVFSVCSTPELIIERLAYRYSLLVSVWVCVQRRIQDSPCEGAPTLRGRQHDLPNFRKTAWNWEHFEPWGCRGCPPHWCMHFAAADRDAHPAPVQMFSFSCTFRQKCCKIICWCTPRVGAPSGKSWIRHYCACVKREMERKR